MGEPVPAFAPLTTDQVSWVQNQDLTPDCLVSMARASIKLKAKTTNYPHDIVSLGLKLHLPAAYQEPLSEMPAITPSGYHFGQILRVKPRQDNGHNYGRHVVMVTESAGQSYGDGARGIFFNSSRLTLGNYLPECLPQDKNTARAPYTSLTLEDFRDSFPDGVLRSSIYGSLSDTLPFLAKLCFCHYKL